MEAKRERKLQASGHPRSSKASAHFVVSHGGVPASVTMSVDGGGQSTKRGLVTARCGKREPSRLDAAHALGKPNVYDVGFSENCA